MDERVDQGTCCDACRKDSQCTTWVYATAPYGGKNCWLMYDVHTTSSAQDRVVGGKVDPPPPSSTCEHVQVGADVTGGARVPDHPDGILVSKQDDCCSACDEDSDCTVWVFASDGSTPQGKNCWLLSSADSTQPSSNRNVGGAVAPTPPPPGSLRVSLGQSGGALYYGAGTGGDDSHTLTRTSSFPKVANTAFYTPHYYSTDGYAALGVSSLQYDPATIYAYPVSWDAHQAGIVQWLVSGDQADLYLMPSSSLYAGLDKYWDLTGRPAVVPKYAFGFLASRWGWENESYIESTLHKFRDGKYPIDAFISDFGWYTPTNDYNLPDTGDPNFHDFSYNPATFPDPTSQLKKYHEELHFRFGGIRKPRLGNSELLAMAHKNGWTVNAPHAAGAPGGTRNLNYSMEVVRTGIKSSRHTTSRMVLISVE